jgi:hypothetical protein
MRRRAAEFARLWPRYTGSAGRITNCQIARRMLRDIRSRVFGLVFSPAWRRRIAERARRQKHIQIVTLNEFHNVSVDASLKKPLALSRA